jgi:hypothetical protein
MNFSSLSLEFHPLFVAFSELVVRESIYNRLVKCLIRWWWYAVDNIIVPELGVGSVEYWFEEWISIVGRYLRRLFFWFDFSSPIYFRLAILLLAYPALGAVDLQDRFGS